MVVNVLTSRAKAARIVQKKHADRLDVPKLLGMAAGALLGNAIAPGLGGMLGGGAAGNWVTGQLRDASQEMKRVFVSFDFDNDRGLKDLIIGQSRHSDSPFNIFDHSLKEAAPKLNWEDKARTAIRRSDVVLVLLGEDTYRAGGVLKEVGIAREDGIHLVQVIGYRDRPYRPIPNAGRVYEWTWDNLKRLLS